jgi:Protein of unknown function (DUF4238)
VSKGYQRNFADEVWLSILDVHTGAVINPRQSIKSNWRVPDFLSVKGAEEEVDDALEREFAKDERVILNVVRDIRPFTKLASEQRRALDRLTVIHLVRSLSFQQKHAAVVTRFLSDDAPNIARNPELAARFERERGRKPNDGELEALVAEQAQELAAAPDLLAGGVRRGASVLDQLLARWTVQLVGVDETLPGLVLADHPVLHGQRAWGRFGFHSAGAIGDSDIILVPIRRHVAACYSASQLPDVRINTRNGVHWINSLLIRGADKEVACHPDDAMPTSRLIRNLDRYPPARFDATTIR